MLFIDACYVNSEGGKTLLFSLIKSLNENKISFIVLLDERSKNKLPDNIHVVHCFYVKSSLWQRYIHFKKILRENPVNKILCFGNIPPIYKIKNIVVYTFLQNVLLIESQGSLVPLKTRIRFILKSLYLSLFKSNTNYWIVQTDNVKKSLVKKLNIDIKKVLVIPFFESLAKENRTIEKRPNTFFYPSTGEMHKNHINLLRAWEVLFEKGYNFELYLTLPDSFIELNNEIAKLKNKGIKIHNLGLLNKADLASQYSISEYLIFPSFFESFGMGIIEAVEFNCRVIAPDLPYVHAVVTPSNTFNPYSYHSIADSVINSINLHNNTTIKVHNNIDNLISLLS